MVVHAAGMDGRHQMDKYERQRQRQRQAKQDSVMRGALCCELHSHSGLSQLLFALLLLL